jgi:hypothetical protein
VTREAEARSAGVNVPITNTSAYSRLRLSEAARDEAAASVESEGAHLAAAQRRVQQDEAIYARAERDREQGKAADVEEETGRCTPRNRRGRGPGTQGRIHRDKEQPTRLRI